MALRERTRNGLTAMPNMTAERRTYPGGSVTYSENVNYGIYSGTFKKSTDTTTAGFALKVKQGAIVNNPCHIAESSFTQCRGSITGEFLTGGSTYHTFTVNDLPLARFLGPISSGNSGYVNLVPSYGLGIKSVQQLYDKAIVTAYSKVRAPEMQSLVTLSELNKTVKLIADTARNLAAAREALKSGKPDKAIARALGRPDARPRPHPIRYVKWDRFGNPIVTNYSKLNRKPKKGQKPSPGQGLLNTYGHRPVRTKDSPHPITELESRWLEWRYGWGPMVMDIVSSLKALNKAREPRRFMVRGFAKDELSASSNKTAITEGTAHYRVDVNHSRQARAYVLYEIDTKLNAALNDFGVMDFPASAWELVPFSFVVDWFIPVGDWLSALTPRIGVNVLASGASFNESLEVTRTVTAWQKNSALNSWDFSALVGKTDSAYTKAYERKTEVSVPAFPPTDVNIGIKRAIDAVALLGTSHSRTLRK